MPNASDLETMLTHGCRKAMEMTLCTGVEDNSGDERDFVLSGRHLRRAMPQAAAAPARPRKHPGAPARKKDNC
jgi:hypothetical protein